MVGSHPANPAEPGDRLLIEASGLSKRYGRVTALDGVTISLDQRAIGLLGANGPASRPS